MKDIIIASNNADKIKEIRSILNIQGVNLIPLYEAGFRREIKETGKTLEENALLKASKVRGEIKNRIIVSDDSGLEVDYIAGAPGVYSARFAGEGCGYDDNNRKLLKILKGVKRKERGAAFRTVACVIFPGAETKLAEGKVRGYITESPKGENGFGYDPLFVPEGRKKTYAQMSDTEKNRISHRKKAFKKAASMIKAKI